MNEVLHELFKHQGHQVLSLHKGDSLFFEDVPIQGIYFLHAGKVKLVKNEEDGKEIILRIICHGELIGHRCFFHRENYGFSAIAIEDCEVSLLPREDVSALIHERNDILLHFLKIFSEELHEADKKLSLLMRKNVGERIAEFLLIALDQFGDLNEGENGINLRLSRDEIASSIGTSHETVTRYLSAFKNKGYIREDKNKIYVITPEKLKRYSDSRKVD